MSAVSAVSCISVGSVVVEPEYEVVVRTAMMLRTHVRATLCRSAHRVEANHENGASSTDWREVCADGRVGLIGKHDTVAPYPEAHHHPTVYKQHYRQDVLRGSIEVPLDDG